MPKLEDYILGRGGWMGRVYVFSGVKPAAESASAGGFAGVDFCKIHISKSQNPHQWCQRHISKIMTE
jgi:hypothetical protein